MCGDYLFPNATQELHVYIRAILIGLAYHITRHQSINIKRSTNNTKQSLKIYLQYVNYPEIVSNNELDNRANIPVIQELLENRAQDIWDKI